MPRPYRQRKRAERQAATRQRIVDATVQLHQEVGPANTTISAIAERAGVQRLTVYRHFPDERSLFLACSSQFEKMNPAPSPEIWQDIADPERRTAAAIDAFYAYYERTEEMLEKVFRDAEENPVLQELNEPYLDEMRLVQRSLAESWNVTGEKFVNVEAAIGHALDFTTWRSLVRVQGLDRESAVALMTQLAARVAEQS